MRLPRIDPSLGRGAAGLVATLAVAGCSADSAPIDSVEPLAPPPPPLDAGCTPLQAIAAGEGCRADWACDDGGALVLACGPLDGGRMCACLVGGAVQATVSLPDDPCGDAGLGSAAFSVCGWVVP